MPHAAADTAVVILAGGDASRFPGKLESEAGGIPLLLRVYRNVRDIGPVYVSSNAPLREDLAREMRCTLVADRMPGRGPLEGLASTFECVAEARCFVVAGDAPFAGADIFLQLRAAIGDADAAVAQSARGIEPLCAIYAREAFLREAQAELDNGSGAVRAVVERLNHVRVRIANDIGLVSVNTPADRAALFGAHQ